ncbi:alpha/beta hydrolase [Actinomadura sp. CNU-125]|uniref:alpha/beta fold hydrolase n=1 Tax=Actinomadura sp. CNU-125 TaxID=1904961 RepID=UPI000961C361|nr:alpha/beta hydrolase [Actinomadura sp. CNU-125]OLT19127.1 alpha/beta hydrolase [Actinomadura sp. CNU-125]
MYSTSSKDGTFIAYDKVGEGPPLILVEGALNDLSTTLPLAAQLKNDFTVYAYDRRGRGASGNTDPYSVERELEDLDGVIAAAGGSALVFGNCSGGVLALQAVAAGLDIAGLAMFEPPYIVPGTRYRPPDYGERLAALLASGRKEDAVEFFMRFDAVLPDEQISMVRGSPMWPALADLAPSLDNDAAVLGDSVMPPADWIASIKVPTLVVDGGNSNSWARESVRVLAESLPGGRRVTLEGHDHVLAPEALAPVMKEFFAALPAPAGE